MARRRDQQRKAAQQARRMAARGQLGGAAASNPRTGAARRQGSAERASVNARRGGRTFGQEAATRRGAAARGFATTMAATGKKTRNVYNAERRVKRAIGEGGAR